MPARGYASTRSAQPIPERPWSTASCAPPAPEAEALAELTRGVPMKRVDEITTGIPYLADPANSFMTGHALALDGGIGAI